MQHLILEKIMKIELIYDRDCPNAAGARQLIKSTVQIAGLKKLEYKEHCRQDEGAPVYAGSYGSPTILINGKDVVLAGSTDGAACRLYYDEAGRMSGLPAETHMLAALRAKNRSTGAVLSTILAVLSGLLPAVSCAACWPAYTAVLSAFGIGFINYTPYLTFILPALLFIALSSLFRSASLRGKYGPFYLGVLAAVLIFWARFLMDLDIVVYAGATLFIIASIWNAWPWTGMNDSGPVCNC